MTPVPSSDLPGHRRLKERTTASLQRCQEDQDVDFKESTPWDKLKWKITHAALGMGNLRDGGIIVIGVSQRNNTWSLTGISDEHFGTYEPDVIIDHVNAYASPHIDLDIVSVTYGGQRFLSILCKEFQDTPLVCKKNGPEGSGIAEGRVYVRPPGMARTTAVTSAAQMHALLDLAAEKRARTFMEMAHRVGVSPLGPTSAFDHFKRELGDL
jgi:predicted HTH transcriptional regulator